MSTFEDQLKSFVFFHLGSDAAVRITSTTDCLQIALEHRRIEPIHFRISMEEAARLCSDRGGFEEYMLDLLTRHRRTDSGG